MISRCTQTTARFFFVTFYDAVAYVFMFRTCVHPRLTNNFAFTSELHVVTISLVTPSSYLCTDRFLCDDVKILKHETVFPGGKIR